MPYSRQRPRVAANGRIGLRFTPAQRDWFIASAITPRKLAQVLHHAVVREGKLWVRVTREELDALIAAAAQTPPGDAKADRALATLLRYLETAADRFEESEDPEKQNEVAP
jgi:hypothetical protein